MTLPVTYADGQTIHGADVNSWTGTINAIINGTTALTLTGPTISADASPTYAAGKLVYDTTNDCLTFFNSDSNVSLQIGQEQWLRVVNNTGSTIANGAAVYISGASSGLPTVALAKANALATSNVVGLTTESIVNGATGYVTVVGAVHGLNTIAFTAGAWVYLDATTAGNLVATAPTAPNYSQLVGVVVVSSATVGVVAVNPGSPNLGIGTANQVLGANNGASGQEYKTIQGTTNDISVVNSAGAITLDIGSNVVTLTGTQTLTNKTLTSPALTTPALGTPASGTLTNCTFPTLNQSTTGNAATATKLATARTVQANLASTSSASFDGTANITPGVTGTLPVGNGGTGAATLTGLVKGTGTTAMVAATAGTDYVAPGGALGTPSSGTLTNCTFPTLNQSTSGNAATATALATARTVLVNLSSTSSASFDGTANIGPGINGTLPVAYGGTGVPLISGLIKGNGVSAFSAATAGTDYVAPGGALGTPSSGTLTNCTFPTLNQSTTGNAATATTASACSGNAATATTLATARTINGVSFNGSANITLPAVPWCPEAIIVGGAIATGYNDLPGGFAVEPGINASGVTLQSVWIRLGTIGATFAASTVLDVYVGTATTQGTLAVSITMASASNNQISTLGTPVSMSSNAVVRINCSTAGAGVTGPIHAQLRGVYNG